MFYINNTIVSALYELIMFVHIILSSVWADELPHLGKELLTGMSTSTFSLFFLIFHLFLYFSRAVSPFILPQTWTQLFWVRASTFIHLRQLSFKKMFLVFFQTVRVVHDVMSHQHCNVTILHNGANSLPIHKNQTTLYYAQPEVRSDC